MLNGAAVIATLSFLAGTVGKEQTPDIASLATRLQTSAYLFAIGALLAVVISMLAYVINRLWADSIAEKEFRSTSPCVVKADGSKRLAAIAAGLTYFAVFLGVCSIAIFVLGLLKAQGANLESTWSFTRLVLNSLPLQICEVAIRNAVVEAIELVHGPNWPWSRGFRRSLPGAIAALKISRAWPRSIRQQERSLQI